MAPASKAKKRLATIAVITILLVLFFVLTNYGRFIVLSQYDSLKLKSFSRQIAAADSATATVLASSVHLTFTGPDLEKILRGISSAKSARMPDAVFMSSAFATVNFHRGTNHLGEVNLSDQLFALPGGPSYFDTTTILKQTVFTPVRQKMNESYSLINK